MSDITKQMVVCRYCGRVFPERPIRTCCAMGRVEDSLATGTPQEAAKALEDALSSDPNDWWKGPPDAQVAYKGVNFHEVR